MIDVYIKLREKLDHLSIGFPKGEGGEELALLESAFTTKEAEFAYELSSDDFETAMELSIKMRRDVEETEDVLDGMVEKGLIFFKRIEGKRAYRFMPWIVGVMELKMGAEPNLDFSKNMGKYMFHGFGGALWKNETPLFRYVPVNKELLTGSAILAQDDAINLIDSKDPERISVIPCMCRQNSRTQGRNCKHIGFETTCIQFNDWTDYFQERGVGRKITVEEAKALVRKAEKEGLLIETVNNEIAHADVICMCCSCCCGPLRQLKNFPGEAIKRAGNYLAEMDKKKCTVCSTCVTRCPLDAISKEEGEKYHIDKSKCIGCGLCVSTCHSNALTLKVKPKEELNMVEKISDLDELHNIIQKEYRKRKGEKA